MREALTPDAAIARREFSEAVSGARKTDQTSRLQAAKRLQSSLALARP